MTSPGAAAVRALRRALPGAFLTLVLTLVLAGCGVVPEAEPEPLPPITPVVLPPSVTQEPASPTDPPPGPGRPDPTPSATPAP